MEATVLDFVVILVLTLPVSIPDEEKKINVKFYFHTSLWYLERFYEGLKGFHKTI